MPTRAAATSAGEKRGARANSLAAENGIETEYPLPPGPISDLRAGLVRVVLIDQHADVALGLAPAQSTVIHSSGGDPDEQSDGDEDG